MSVEKKKKTRVENYLENTKDVNVDLHFIRERGMLNEGEYELQC